MEENKIKKNYLYNVIYQVLAMAVILITTPYVSRVLGSDGIGTYGYTYSIVSYFILFGSLGISMYGQRQIAYCKDDKSKYSKVFFELFFLKAVTLLLSTVLFYFLYASHGEYQFFYKILMIELVGNIFDIMWFFQGMEDFKKVVIRNIALKIISVIAIFLFVKQASDLWIYFLIYSSSTIFGNLSLWIRINRIIEISAIRLISIKEIIVRHFRTIISLLIPQISMQIYTVFDKTMIGQILNDMNAVGFYEQSQKIIKLALMIVAAFGTIIFSRMSISYAKANKKELNKCVDIAFDFVWLFAIPITFGMAAIAPTLVPWFFGKEFEAIIPLMFAFSPIILIIGVSNVVFTQYLISTEKQNKFSKAVIAGAVTNVIINFLLIKPFGVIGAVISSVIAEFLILLIEYFYIRKEIKMKDNFRDSYKYFFASIVMFIIIFLIGTKLPATVTTTFIQIVIGIVIYISILLITKEKQLMAFLEQLKGRIRRL